MAKADMLFQKIEILKQDYKDHFKKDIPEKIIRGGNPLNILDHHEELEEG